VRPKGQGAWAARIQENYPSAALRKEIEGTVGVRVTVGPDGRVSACSVTGSSGSGDLDSAACEGMQRYARFDPALDKDGNPTSGSFSTRIVYRIN
jgi:periplasmic protein TonB